MDSLTQDLSLKGTFITNIFFIVTRLFSCKNMLNDVFAFNSVTVFL